MFHEKTVLVFSDDNKLDKELTTILRFLSVTPSLRTIQDWTAVPELCISAEQVGVVICCSSKNIAEFGVFLNQLFSVLGEVAVISLGNVQVKDSSIDDRIQRMQICHFDTLPEYVQLNDALHQCQCFYEAVKNRKAMRQKRPVHLFRSLVGTSQQIQAVRKVMGQVSDKDVTVLIEGESGTGKEVVARNLHYHSERRSAPFVPVNCGAIPAELLESELFGHEKGAFTGAVNSRSGRFEMAEGGTLFLDEIGDMPLHMQVKILRVLQEKTYERVGGNRSFRTNVRVIAATHRNLEKMIDSGDFREDLYYRLNVFPIEMPSLRARSEDIPLLINELIKRMETEGRGSVRFSSSAILSLCEHPWPGNVRELANLVERMAIMNPYSVVGVRELPLKYRHVEPEASYSDLAQDDSTGAKPSMLGVGDTMLLPEEGIDLKDYIAGLERNLIQQALDNNSGIVARAADQLMIRRTTLVEKMRKYDMHR